MTALAVLALAALGFLGAPLFALIGAAGLGAFRAQGTDVSAVIVELYRLASLPALVAVPLFTFAGYVLAEGESPKRMVRLAQALFGWIPGGLAVVAIVSCSLFTAFTGASGVTIIALGGLLYPVFLQEGFRKSFTLGLLATTGSLGLLFPPSLPIILYGLVAGVSIDDLFRAGLVPGLLILAALAGMSLWEGRRDRVATVPFSPRAVRAALRESAWELPLPLLVIGGIYLGWFTAPEAAAVTAAYVVFTETVCYRELSLTEDIPRAAVHSMLLVGAIFAMLGTALGLTSWLIDAQVPARIFDALHAWVQSKTAFLILLNCFLLLANMVEIFSAIVIVVPLIVPVAAQYGIDPVHLGIIFLLNLEIGYMTPPLGLNLFLASFRFKRPLPEVYRAVLPFWAMLLAILLLVTYVPAFSLALPAWLRGSP